MNHCAGGAEQRVRTQAQTLLQCSPRVLDLDTEGAEPKVGVGD